jgi:hypothetical protein
MKILLFCFSQLFVFSSFAQGSLTGIYSPIYDWFFINDNIIGLSRFYEDSLYKITDKSVDGVREIRKYYSSGELAMCFSNVKDTIIYTESLIRYPISGEVKTYFKNGNLRTQYSLVEDYLIGGFKIYNKKGKLSRIDEYRNYEIYNGWGVYSDKTGREKRIFLYKNGIIMKKYLFVDNKHLFIIENDLSTTKTAKRKIRKVIKEYYIKDEVIILTR